MVYSYHRKVIGVWDQFVTNKKLIKPIRIPCTLQFFPSTVAQQCTAYAVVGSFSSIQPMTCNNKLHTLA